MTDRKRISRRRLLRVGAGVAAVGAYSFLVEPSWIELVKRDVPIKGLGPGLDGFKIGLLSDFHIPNCIDREFLRGAMAMLAAEKPDMYAMPGDMYHGGAYRVTSLDGYFDGFDAPYGHYFSTGNHDYWAGIDRVLRRVRDETPFEPLLNSHVMIERGGSVMALGGTNDYACGAPNVETAFKGVDPKTPRIMLAHNPDICEEWDRGARVDLALSGHTHGGQIKVLPWYAPFTNSRYGQKFREGLVQGKFYRTYVTRGLARAHHCRFMARPEVTVLTLRQA